MRTQTLLILALALTLGGIAAGGVMLYSSGHASGAEAQATMVLATVDIPRGENLTADVLKVVKVSRNSRLAGVVANVSDAEGRSTLMPLISGEPILEAKLAPKGAGRGLSSLIKKGMRAISIPTPNVGTGVSGFIVPGSRVDIHWHPQNGQGFENPTVPDPPLLENVEVLAVDDKIDIPATNRTDAAQMKSVTVQVRPEEAGQLTPALTKGTVHLTLRNPADDGRAPPRPVKVEPIEKLMAPPPPPAPPPPRFIRILRGHRETLFRLDPNSNAPSSDR